MHDIQRIEKGIKALEITAKFPSDHFPQVIVDGKWFEKLCEFTCFYERTVVPFWIYIEGYIKEHRIEFYEKCTAYPFRAQRMLTFREAYIYLMTWNMIDPEKMFQMMGIPTNAANLMGNGIEQAQCDIFEEGIRLFDSSMFLHTLAIMNYIESGDDWFQESIKKYDGKTYYISRSHMIDYDYINKTFPIAKSKHNQHDLSEKEFEGLLTSEICKKIGIEVPRPRRRSSRHRRQATYEHESLVNFWQWIEEHNVQFGNIVDSQNKGVFPLWIVELSKDLSSSDYLSKCMSQFHSNRKKVVGVIDHILFESIYNHRKGLCEVIKEKLPSKKTVFTTIQGIDAKYESNSKLKCIGTVRFTEEDFHIEVPENCWVDEYWDSIVSPLEHAYDCFKRLIVAYSYQIWECYKFLKYISLPLEYNKVEEILYHSDYVELVEKSLTPSSVEEMVKNHTASLFLEEIWDKESPAMSGVKQQYDVERSIGRIIEENFDFSGECTYADWKERFLKKLSSLVNMYMIDKTANGLWAYVFLFYPRMPERGRKGNRGEKPVKLNPCLQWKQKPQNISAAAEVLLKDDILAEALAICNGCKEDTYIPARCVNTLIGIYSQGSEKWVADFIKLFWTQDMQDEFYRKIADKKSKKK